LSAKLNHGPGVPTFSVSVTPAALPPGTYMGNVTLSASGAAPAQLPVTLTVWSNAPPLVVTPSSLVFILPSDEVYSGEQTLNLSSGGVPLPVTVTTTTADGGDWLFANTSLYLQFMPVTPAALPVNAGNFSGMLPATYRGSFTLTAASGSVVVPATLVITAGPYTSPSIGSIVNAASGIQGGVSPGEIVTIHGIGMGELGRSLALDSNGNVGTELNGTQVLFDGVPAPLLYASVSQLNVVTPYQVANQNVTNVQVVYNGLRSPAWGVPVLPAAPAIFTIEGSGVGPGAVLNQDNSMNSALNPAVRGSVIQIFGTGEGITNPAGVTGSVTGTVTQKPVLPVSVSIGGVNATVLYAGSAPDAVAGLLQVNAIVPLSVTPGGAIPIVMTVGSASSPSDITIAVQ
jgi:uncharacterized protein (TIGR03437 family)